MSEFKFRTEDIRPEEILPLFVATKQDRSIVDQLKAPTPVVLEGSRGTGKSFLLRVAEAELDRAFVGNHELPVYVSFAKSSLLHTADPLQFHNWMLSRLCSRLVRAFEQRGLLTRPLPATSILAGEMAPVPGAHHKIQQIAQQYEDSYRSPGQTVNVEGLPDVESFRDAVEDLCRAFDVKRITLFFDEAAHIFRPEQQRQFFTLFRDLRSPFIGCNAAVYPGVTYYGSTFQPAHDATLLKIDRDILDPDYLRSMREIVERQAGSELLAAMARNSGNFNLLAYAVSGNPRLLLKTVARAAKMNSQQVGSVVKEFYRSDIWSEHTALSDVYSGHKKLVDWGRDFLEGQVLIETKAKNDQWRAEGKTESTCYFWIHRDAPAAVIEALRLLSYTGIVVRGESGVRATRSELGTRYAVNLGCLFALEANPAATGLQIAQQLTPKRFSEYGANHPSYRSLLDVVGTLTEPDMTAILKEQLGKPITVLDITKWQFDNLTSVGLDTVGKVLEATEEKLQQIKWVGEKRSRRIKNEVVEWVLEYLSG